MGRSPFTYRMMHAIAPELVDYAARLGMNYAVVASSGHKGGSVKDDPPVYLPQYGEFFAIRQKSASVVESERTRVRGMIRRAHKAGMKAIYHTYEPSLPYGFKETYGRIFSRQLSQYVKNGPPEAAAERELCIARADVQRVITAKVEEICRTFGELDGFMYSNNESSSTTKVWHRCDHCRDIPYSVTMKMLHDAIAEGIARSGRPIRLYWRMWGVTDVDTHYWQANKMRVDFGVSDVPAKRWLRAWVETHQDAKLHFKPSRDVPAFEKSLATGDTVFVYKATWADTNLHHPLNPIIGTFPRRDEVCELSFEHCSRAPRGFYIMGREMQRRARLCRDRGVKGMCVVPIHWGENELIPSAYTPSRWSLADLNMDLFRALAENPDAGLERVTMSYLKNRYGKTLPRELAAMLLDSEDVAADSMNIRGIRATGKGLENFFYELIRYAPMFPQWRKRVFPTPQNLRLIWNDKQRNTQRAAQMVQRIEQLENKMPAEAYREFHECFSHLARNARAMEFQHKYCMTLWALKEGTIKPTTAPLEQMHSYVQELLRLGLTPSANTLHKD